MLVLGEIGKTTDTTPIQPGSRVSRYWQDKLEYYPKYSKYVTDSMLRGITAQRVCETFGYHSIEFGNWVNQNERQNALVNIAMSSINLATVMDIEPKKIGFNEIAFAYGARGNGGNAAAFYLPSKRLINLTKPHGASSMAHEYGHALDYRISRSQGDVLLSTQAYEQIVKQEKPKTNIEKAYYTLMYSICFTQAGKQTQMFSDSLEMQNSGYWASPRELFARTFEAFVRWDLASKGQRNYFLTSQKYGKLYPTVGQLKKMYGSFRYLSVIATFNQK